MDECNPLPGSGAIGLPNTSRSTIGIANTAPAVLVRLGGWLRDDRSTLAAAVLIVMPAGQPNSRDFKVHSTTFQHNVSTFCRCAEWLRNVNRQWEVSC